LLTSERKRSGAIPDWVIGDCFVAKGGLLAMTGSNVIALAASFRVIAFGAAQVQRASHDLLEMEEAE
jgi:hypothetical protein